MACNCSNKTALCLSGGCQILLSSMCVIYEGETLTYIGGNTNDSVQVLLQKIDEKLSTLETGGGTGTVTSFSVSAGSGITASVTNPTTTPQLTIANSAPDQVVTLTAGTNISITGTYPNFTINSTGGAGVSDGDKGDITVSSSGATWTIDTNIVKTWTGKHTWTPNINYSGINVGSYAGDAAIPLDGDIYYNNTSTINDFYARINGYWTSMTTTPHVSEGAAYRLITQADRRKVIRLVNTNPITVEFPTGLSLDFEVTLWKGAGSGNISLTGTIEGVATTMLTDNTAVTFQHRGGGIWMASGALGTSGGGGGITSINGLTTGTQFFVNDTNITMVSSGGNHTITWAGTLADARITSASTWNAKIGGSGTSGQLSVFNASGTITSDSGALYSSGTITTSTSLISTIVAANTLILGKDTSQTSTSYSIQTQGTQTNIDIQLVAKGNGDLNVTGTSWASTLKIDDSSNDIRIYQFGSALTSPKLRLIGWGGDATQTLGGSIEITGGAAYNTGNTNGGSVILKSGAKNGSGTDGNIELDSLTGIVKLTQTPATGGTNTQVLTRDSSTGAIEVRDQNTIGRSVLNLLGHSSNLNQNTTYYFGIHPNTPTTSASIRKIYFRQNVTIKHVEIYSQSVTAGSNENWSMYVRVDSTTDTLIQTIGVSTGERIWTNTGLSIDVDADHYVEIKMVTPTTWSTAPVTTVFSGYIVYEYR